MKTRVVLIFFMGFFLHGTGSAQKCPPFYEKGTLYYATENKESGFCYRREPVSDINPDIFHTKYTIANAGGKEMYNIHFYFYKQLDSISVVYLNTLTGASTRKTATFKAHSSTRMFKNYEANDTAISTNTLYCTLFTVPETARPYIILNQFQLPDDEFTYLSVSPVNPDKLQQHLAEVELYNKYQDSLNLVTEQENEKIAQHKKAISDLLNEMKEYKDNEIRKIKDEDEVFNKGENFLEASNMLSEKFRDEMDQLFTGYYRTVFPFDNSASDMSFTFFCDANGRIDPSKTDIHSVNSLKLKWIEDGFRANIEPLMSEKRYKTVLVPRFNPTLITDFDAKYKDAFNELKPDNDEYAEYLAVKKEIYNQFDKYLKREMNSPTKYTYLLKYRSTVEYSEWIYEVSRKGIEKIGPKGMEETITQNLINIFKEKIAKPKVGKYKVKICSVFLNNLLVAQDIAPNLN